MSVTHPLLRRALPLVLLAALAAAPAQAKTDAATQKELDQARKELREARDELREAARNYARVQREAAPDDAPPFARAFEFMNNPRRAMLGVAIEPGPEQAGKRRGVLVSGVTPGSGADKAGVKTGDLILAVNGQSLELAAGSRPGPGHNLREALAKLEPGTSVNLLIERAGKPQNLSVSLSAPQGPMAFALPPIDIDVDRLIDDADVALPHPPHGRGHPMMAMAGFVGPGFQLARLDEDLAGYFKTRDGVLVVKAPPVADGAPALKSGDVIQRINNEAVSNPVEAMEKLANIGPQGAVTLSVLRQGASISLQGKLPEGPVGGPHFRHIQKRLLRGGPGA